MQNNQSVELQDLLKTVTEEEHFAYTELDAMDYTVRPAWEAKQAEARVKLPNLRTKLQNAVASRLVKVFVAGSPENVEELVGMLSTEVPTFTVKPFYVEVAECLLPTLGREAEVTGATYLSLNDVLRKYAGAYRVMPHSVLPQLASVVTPDIQQLAGVVRDTTRAAFGDVLNGAYIYHQVTNEAIAKSFTKEVGVVVLTGMTKEEKKELNGVVFQNTQSIDVVLKTKPDKGIVTSILKKLTENSLNDVK